VAGMPGRMMKAIHMFQEIEIKTNYLFKIFKPTDKTINIKQFPQFYHYNSVGANNKLLLVT
jgi:hypothetical protein